jgi:hypothetical protein
VPWSEMSKRALSADGKTVLSRWVHHLGVGEPCQPKEIVKFRVLSPEWDMKLLVATSSHALGMIKIPLLTELRRGQKI